MTQLNTQIQLTQEQADLLYLLVNLEMSRIYPKRANQLIQARYDALFEIHDLLVFPPVNEG